jgi:carboxy-terminal domain RNA polymerase II polypeptide A small phosphatase
MTSCCCYDDSATDSDTNSDTDGASVTDTNSASATATANATEKAKAQVIQRWIDLVKKVILWCNIKRHAEYHQFKYDWHPNLTVSTEREPLCILAYDRVAKVCLSVDHEVEAQDKKILVLDLDGTLVHAEKMEKVEKVDAKQVKIPHFIIRPDLQTSYRVYERPSAREFILCISKAFHTVLFTAAELEYACLILDQIDPQKRIRYIYHRNNCHFCEVCVNVNVKEQTSYESTSTSYEYVKNLRLVHHDMKNVIIIDNTPTAFSLQPYNGIPIVTFPTTKGFQEDYLLQLCHILKHLQYEDDVRYLISFISFAFLKK